MLPFPLVGYPFRGSSSARGADPLQLRGVGSRIVTLINWTTAAIVTGFYLDYAERVKRWFAWWMFSVMNLLAVLFVVFFVSETKDKSLEEINNRYKKQPKKHHNHS